MKQDVVSRWHPRIHQNRIEASFVWILPVPRRTRRSHSSSSSSLPKFPSNRNWTEMKAFLTSTSSSLSSTSLPLIWSRSNQELTGELCLPHLTEGGKVWKGGEEPKFSWFLQSATFSSSFPYFGFFSAQLWLPFFFLFLFLSHCLSLVSTCQHFQIVCKTLECFSLFLSLSLWEFLFPFSHSSSQIWLSVSPILYLTLASLSLPLSFSPGSHFPSLCLSLLLHPRTQENIFLCFRCSVVPYFSWRTFAELSWLRLCGDCWTFSKLKRLEWRALSSGCSTEVKHRPRNWEIVGSNAFGGAGVFSLLFLPPQHCVF